MVKKRYFNDVASYEKHQIAIYLKKYGDTSTIELWTVMKSDSITKKFISKDKNLKGTLEKKSWVENKLKEMRMPFTKFKSRQSLNNALSKLRDLKMVKRIPESFEESRDGIWRYIPMEEREPQTDTESLFVPIATKNNSKSATFLDIKLKKLDFDNLDCHIVPVYDSYDDPDFTRYSLRRPGSLEKSPLDITEPIYRQPIKDTPGNRFVWDDSLGAISTISPKFKPEISQQIKARTIEYQRDILNIIAKEYQNQMLSLIDGFESGDEKTKEILKIRIVNGDYDINLTRRGWVINIAKSTIEMDEIIKKIIDKIESLIIVNQFTPAPHINPTDKTVKCAWLSDKYHRSGLDSEIMNKLGIFQGSK
ncbi:MAG: hypothetical protein KAS32_29940 [Candidatus Peribacteraceae bacterium]|nr:hypothetical protein [Candidatus Peribacteraceae bacterium]